MKNFVLIFLLCLSGGCFNNSQKELIELRAQVKVHLIFKPGDKVKDKITGKEYLVLTREINYMSQAKYDLRAIDINEIPSYTSRLEIELEPVVEQ